MIDPTKLPRGLVKLAQDLKKYATNMNAGMVRATLGNCAKLGGWSLTVIVHDEDFDEYFIEI